MNPLYFLGALIIIAGYWTGILYAPFLLNITISFLLLSATSRIHAFFMKHLKYTFVASFASTTLLALLFFAPIIYLIYIVLIQFSNVDVELLKQYAKVLQGIIDKDLPSSLEFIRPYLNESISSENIAIYATKGVDLLSTFAGKSAGFIKDILFITIFYFFLLIYGRTIGNFFQDVIPLNPGQTQKLYYASSNTMSIVFYSIIVTAFLEGSLFALIAWMYGFNPLLFGLLYGFASLIPVVGGALLWVPLSSYELVNGHENAALTIALYSVIVISIFADTFVKPMIIKYINVAFIKSKVAVNSLITFFAIFAGLSSFGFWGMIIGPAITSFFLSLLNLYKEMSPGKTKEEPVPIA